MGGDQVWAYNAGNLGRENAMPPTSNWKESTPTCAASLLRWPVRQVPWDGKVDEKLRISVGLNSRGRGLRREGVSSSRCPAARGPAGPGAGSPGQARGGSGAKREQSASRGLLCRAPQEKRRREEEERRQREAAAIRPLHALGFRRL